MTRNPGELRNILKNLLMLKHSNGNIEQSLDGIMMVRLVLSYTLIGQKGGKD